MKELIEEAKDKINNLLEAHRELEYFWSDNIQRDEINEILCKSYPYEMSFDELLGKLEEWEEDASKLAEDIKENL